MGLLDYDLSPQQLGLLGAAAAAGNAYAPQPASRLPLAKPNLAYTLSQMAGGLGQGYGYGQQVQGQQIQNQANQLALQRANMQMQFLPMFAQSLGVNPPGAMAATGPGSSPAPTAQAASAQGAALPAGVSPPPAGGSVPAVFQPPQAQQQSRPMLNLAQTWKSAQLADLAGFGQFAKDQRDYVKSSLIPGSTIMDDGSVGLAPGVPKALQEKYMADQGYEWSDKGASFVPAAGLLKGKFQMSQAEAAGKVGPALQEAAGKAGIDIGTNRQKLTDTAVSDYGANAAPQFGPVTYGGGYGFSPLLGTQSPSMAPQGAPTASMPPMGAPPAAGPPPIQAPQKTEAAGTYSDKGTFIPARPMSGEFPTMPGTKGAQAGIDQVKAENDKIIPEWDQSRQLLDTTANRLQTLSKLSQASQMGAFSQDRAEWANKLNSLGFTKLANAVDKGDMNNVKQFEYEAYNEVLNQLKAINQGTGGRMLKVEVESMAEKGISADMPPKALYGSITNTLGQVWRARNMIDDFHNSGWVNAGKFASQWQANPTNSIENHQEVARNYLGPFKGMESNITAPAGAIKALQMDPTRRAEFEQKYGAGSAAPYLK